MSALTWNCAGSAPPKEQDFKGDQILFDGPVNKDSYPDIFVIGLQEMVKLKAT